MEQGTGRAARPPRKLLKYALYGFAAVALAIGGATLYLVLTFDPRDHYARIIEFVRDKTGRTLDIRGGIQLSFWPDLGVRLGALTLSERDSAEPFASIESARLTVDFGPLLERELVVSDIVLVGATLSIVRFENGTLNVDDLLQGEGGTPQFDIGRISVERSSIIYRDLRSGTRLVASDIALETGRLTNDVVTPIELAWRLRDDKDTFAVSSALSGRVRLDLSARRYALEQAALDVNGRVPGVNDVAVRASGDAVFERATNELRLRTLAVALAGTYGPDEIALALNAASLRLHSGQATGESLRMSVVAEGTAGRTEITLSSAELRRTEHHIASDAVSLDVALERGGHRFTATIGTALDAQIAGRKLMLTDMAADFTAAGRRLPHKGIAGAVKGEAHLDLAREGVQLELTGKVAESRVKARLTSAGFAAPVYTFAVELDRLDLDRYTERGGESRALTGHAGAGGSNLLAPLASVPATGSLNVGVLTAAGTTARNVRLTLQ